MFFSFSHDDGLFGPSFMWL